MTMHQGGCACGEVRYSTSSEVRRAVVCHCRYCQTRTGSAFGISVYFDKADVKIHTGELSTYTYKTESGGSGTTRFCKNCGTLMFGNSSGRTNVVSIRAGTVDQTDIIKPVMNVFVDSKVTSTPMHDDLPQASEMPHGESWKKD